MTTIQSVDRPKALAVRPEGIPEELKALRRWVLWSYTRDDEGKWTKPPYRVDGGGKASSTDPATWSSFPDALAVYKSGRPVSSGSPADGIGFMFEDSGYFGVDLDDFRDPTSGEIKPEALAIVRDLAAWGEVSASGRGVHLIGRGKLPPGGRRRGKIEAYDRGRYFTMTGHVLPDVPLAIADRQDAINAFHAKHLGDTSRKRTAKPAAPSAVLELDDAALIEKAKAAENGAKFAALLSGDVSAYDGDESRADLALCSHLAFWFGKDPARMDRVFRASGLMRPKWEAVHFGDGATYGQRTIEKAIAGTTDTYKHGRNGDPARPRATSTASAIPLRVVELPEAEAPTLPSEAYDLAPGPFQNIIRFYAGRTEAPDSFLLFSLATWAGALLGRTVHNPYSNEGIYPLLYTILVAPAGGRKTTADNIIRRAIVPPKFDATFFSIAERRGTIGSGPALLEILAEAENTLGNGATTIWRPPEWAGVLRASERPGGSDLVPMLLGAFDGFTDYTHSVRNKKTEKGGVSVHLQRPGLAIISTAQETMLRNYLSAETVGLGLASRLLMVYHGAPVEAVPFPERAFTGADYSTVNAAAHEIREAAKSWRDRAKDKPDGIPIEIPEESNAAETWAKWYTTEYEKIRATGTRDADRAAELLVRVPEYARRLALIRAAVERRDAINAADVEWGIVLAEFGGASSTHLCRGAGQGETKQDARSKAIEERLHEAGGHWVEVRDIYRGRRSFNAAEAWKMLESLDSMGRISLFRARPALARCLCSKTCRAAEKEGA